jgi:hypothetical protein
MKSVIIKQNGKKIIHLKRNKQGVDKIILNGIEVEITCILHNNSRIKF